MKEFRGFGTMKLFLNKTGEYGIDDILKIHIRF